jgi:hypothetical protein
MEPPYSIPEPRLLTERLCHQWLRIRAQNRQLCQVSHSLELAHVEPNVPSTRNTEHLLLCSHWIIEEGGQVSMQE